MLGFKDFIKKSGNDHRDIEEFPDEANRQLKLFHNHIHRPLTPHDSDEDDKPQDTNARDAFHKKHGMVRIPIDDIEKRSKEVARHLDLYHQNYPEVARHFNMRPMNSFNTKLDLGMDGVKTSLARTGRKIYDTLRGKDHNKEEGKRLATALHNLHVNNGDELRKMTADNINQNHELVKAWHEDNPDHHHLTGSQAYGNFKYDLQKLAPHRRVPSEQEFTDHWDDLKHEGR